MLSHKAHLLPNMCGFIAIYKGLQSSLLPSTTRLDAITHRGPDAAGEWCEGDGSLDIADCRSLTWPPAISRCRVLMALCHSVNGGIYNSWSCASVLKAERATFRTRSDTEVILEGYRHWGSVSQAATRQCLPLLSGIVYAVLPSPLAIGLALATLCWALHFGALVSHQHLSRLVHWMRFWPS